MTVAASGAVVVSDLHLGARVGIATLADPGPRERLAQALSRAGTVVLAGDVLELRESSQTRALAAARPILAQLGRARGERDVIVLAGNHDHRLIERWRQERRAADAGPLALEQVIEPERASAVAAQMAQWLAPARVRIAYPGIWVRDDVYVTHGHQLDRHLTIPAFEPLTIRLLERLLARRGDDLEGVDGYEAVMAPIYAGFHELAQTAPVPVGPSGPSPSLSARAYRVLASDGAGPRPLHHRALGAVALPAVVAALNAVGLGPLQAQLSGPRLRQAALDAMGQAVRTMGIDAAHVVFGHTHRAGPLPGDDRGEWMVPGVGTRLHNSGSWVRERFLAGSAPESSPYRAGASVWIGAEGEPEVRHLLD